MRKLSVKKRLLKDSRNKSRRSLIRSSKRPALFIHSIWIRMTLLISSCSTTVEFTTIIRISI